MRLLLDSADIGEIRRFFPGNTLAGVTTNPSLVAKQPKGDYMALLREIASVLELDGSDPQHLSVEVTTLDPDGMIEQAMGFKEAFGKNIHVKIPLMPETIRVIEHLSGDVKVNATACMTAIQAKIANDAGADIVSFFFNRMIDGFMIQNRARQAAIDEIRGYCSTEVRGLSNAQVICGSIRTPQDIWDCWDAGAYLVTAPAKVIDAALRHEKTVEAIGQFQKDIDAWQG
jgi:TalC/MipB family fructose-6-phosphate aldolase